MDCSAKKICDKYGKGIPYVMVISYILEKGEDMISQITNEQIEQLKENSMMTADFVRGLVRTAREVVQNCSQEEIIRLIKSEWCCSGERYDPDLEQFVNIIDEEDW